MRPYLVFGAGAVGSALSAYLARRGHSVSMIAREAHCRAIAAQGGLRTVSRSESFLAPVHASPVVPDQLPAETVIYLTVQSQNVEASLDALEPHLAGHTLVTWQNGIQSEATAAARANVVYGGVVRFTSTMLEPGEVRLRAPGKLIVGRHAGGDDAEGASLSEDLNTAGFETALSHDIGADKALKLLVNLVSGPPVLLERTGKEPVLAAVQVAVLEEAARIFEASRIKAYPASGIGQTVDELIDHFRTGGSAPDTSGGIYNSTWQNLHHRRARIENRFYHGEVVKLGERVGMEAPVNTRVLEVLEEVCRDGLGPEPFDRDTFASRFADLVSPDQPPSGDVNPGGGNLEI